MAQLSLRRRDIHFKMMKKTSVFGVVFIHLGHLLGQIDWQHRIHLIRPHVNSSTDKRSSLDKHHGDPDLWFSQRHWQLYPTLTLGAKLVDAIGAVAVAGHAADEQKRVAV